MPQRRFLIASALARLIRKEQGLVGRIVEGYFPARPDRDHFVSIEPGHAYLVLAAGPDGAGDEERTEVPRSQAEALLTVCAGKVGFEATILQLRTGKDALLQRFIAPGLLNLLSVEFEDGEDPNGFVPPAWFGPEVTQDPAYDRGSLARAGIPAPEDIPLSNAMLDELLDALDSSRGDSLSEPRPSAALPSGEQTPARSGGGVDMEGIVAGLAQALDGLDAPEQEPSHEKASAGPLGRVLRLR